MTDNSNSLTSKRPLTSDNYEKWMSRLSEVRKWDGKDGWTLDPEKIKTVTIEVPAWVAARMDYKCPSCGWLVYIINVGPSQFHYCTNPECGNNYSFNSISASLQHQDRMIRERSERINKKKNEKIAKAEEERKLDLMIENRIRRILFSYGVKVSKNAEEV